MNRKTNAIDSTLSEQQIVFKHENDRAPENVKFRSRNMTVNGGLFLHQNESIKPDWQAMKGFASYVNFSLSKMKGSGAASSNFRSDHMEVNGALILYQKQNKQN